MTRVPGSVAVALTRVPGFVAVAYAWMPGSAALTCHFLNHLPDNLAHCLPSNLHGVPYQKFQKRRTQFHAVDLRLNDKAHFGGLAALAPAWATEKAFA